MKRLPVYFVFVAIAGAAIDSSPDSSAAAEAEVKARVAADGAAAISKDPIGEQANLELAKGERELADGNFNSAGFHAWKAERMLARTHKTIPAERERLAKLKAAIEVAGTPIKVQFVSDGATSVYFKPGTNISPLSVRPFVYIPPLIRFRSETRMLAPGHYLVVCHRYGYLDEPVEFEVMPELPSMLVKVVCTQRLP